MEEANSSIRVDNHLHNIPIILKESESIMISHFSSSQAIFQESKVEIMKVLIDKKLLNSNLASFSLELVQSFAFWPNFGADYPVQACSSHIIKYIK